MTWFHSCTTQLHSYLTLAPDPKSTPLNWAPGFRSCYCSWPSPVFAFTTCQRRSILGFPGFIQLLIQLSSIQISEFHSDLNLALSGSWNSNYTRLQMTLLPLSFKTAYSWLRSSLAGIKLIVSSWALSLWVLYLLTYLPYTRCVSNCLLWPYFYYTIS